MYVMLRNKLSDNSLDRLNAWRTDLGVDITENEWEEACFKAQTQSINTALKIIQYKWLFRTYITPVKLHQYDPNIPDNCAKCIDDVGTLLHCMWNCPKIQLFWKVVADMISHIAVIDIPLDAKFCILGIYPVHFVPGRKSVPLINLCLLQARRVIALRWKSMDGPTSAMWLHEMTSCLAMEKLTYIAKGWLCKFEEIWDSCVRFLEADQPVINE